MQAAMKTNKSANLALLANGIKKASDVLALITHDDDVIENLAEMDGFDRMSASQLRAKARELKAENEATQKVLDKKNAELDKQARHIAKTTPDQKLLELQKEATALMNDALGCIRGNLRQAFIQIKNHDDNDHTLFMAGLLGQVQVDLAALRHEFNLPDLSTAADAQLAAEVAQWAGA